MATSMRVLFSIFVVWQTTMTFVHCDCSEISVFGVGSANEKLIVDTHNDMRFMIANGQITGQPKGTNLKLLIWEPSLAQKAQEVSDICVNMRHSFDNENFNMGQNLFITSSDVKGPQWKKVLDGWFSEYQNYTYPLQQPSTNHYTQMVWANTRYVGCGYSSYEANDLSQHAYKEIYACEYAPGGNNEAIPYAIDGPDCEGLCQ